MDPIVKRWWDALEPTDQIVRALEVRDGESAVYVALHPWKWAPEAYDKAHEQQVNAEQAAAFIRRAGFYVIGEESK